jgi:hypothetical protein
VTLYNDVKRSKLISVKALSITKDAIGQWDATHQNFWRLATAEWSAVHQSLICRLYPRPISAELTASILASYLRRRCLWIPNCPVHSVGTGLKGSIVRRAVKGESNESRSPGHLFKMALLLATSCANTSPAMSYAAQVHLRDGKTATCIVNGHGTESLTGARYPHLPQRKKMNRKLMPSLGYAEFRPKRSSIPTR